MASARPIDIRHRQRVRRRQLPTRSATDMGLDRQPQRRPLRQIADHLANRRPPRRLTTTQVQRHQQSAANRRAVSCRRQRARLRILHRWQACRSHSQWRVRRRLSIWLRPRASIVLAERRVTWVAARRSQLKLPHDRHRRPQPNRPPPRSHCPAATVNRGHRPRRLHQAPALARINSSFRTGR